jgi:signal transduction histidine kinase
VVRSTLVFPLAPAAALLDAQPYVPDARLLFLVNLLVVLAVAGFASATILILLRRSYAKRLEEEKLATMGTVTARILHQLKNPLQSMILQSELLQEFDRVEEGDLRREAAAAIATEAHRLANMLSELSVWAAGSRRSLDLEPTPLHELIGDFARRVAYEIEKGGVHFDAEIRAEAVVDADSYFLQQALDNLARNAQEALRDRVDARLRIELDGDESAATIRVVDNGPGIPADRLETVFQPFTSGKSSGMGLGLPICREIVEAHRGELRVESTPGEGTVFTVTIPLSPRDRKPS